MTLHFISGLPRSGSTLLASILRQNPRFHASMSSPVGSIFNAVHRAVSRANEAAMFIKDVQRVNLLQGVFEGFYDCELEAPATETFFDTGRLWCSKLPVLAELFPDAKVICCVRDVAWIMDSLERQIQSHPLQLSGIFGYETGGTVYTRAAALGASSGMVGYALDAFREAFYGEHAKRLFVLDYEVLCRAPADAIALLYDFLGEPRFRHDFGDVAFEADEFDAALGTPGLHRVRAKVEWIPRKTVLPPGLFEAHRNTFWRDPQQNTNDALVIQP